MKNSEESTQNSGAVPLRDAIPLESQYVVCTVPHLPHSKLGPNARNNYWKRNSYVQSAKEEMVMLLLMQQCRQNPLWEIAHLEILFTAGDKRRRDLDNLIASCKPWIDALVGMVIVDDSADRLSLSARYQRESEPSTCFTIWHLP